MTERESDWPNAAEGSASDNYSLNEDQLSPFEGDGHGESDCVAVEDCLCATDAMKRSLEILGCLNTLGVLNFGNQVLTLGLLSPCIFQLDGKHVSQHRERQIRITWYGVFGVIRNWLRDYCI